MEQLSLDQIIEQSENDLEIDALGDLSKQVSQQPKIFSKWLRILKHEALKLRKLENSMESLKSELWIYYTGKADPEVYKERPMDTRFLKSEVSDAIKSDQLYRNLNMKLTIQSEVVDTLERIMERVKARDWQLKNIIEWKKFESGI